MKSSTLLAFLFLLSIRIPVFNLDASQVLAQAQPESVLQDADDIFSRPEFLRYKNRNPSDGESPFGSSKRIGQSGRGEGGRGGENQGAGDERGSRSGHSDGSTSERQSSDGESNRNSEMSNREQPDSDSKSYRGGSFGDFGSGMAGLFKILGILALVCMVGLILWLMIPAFINVDRKLEDTTQRDLLNSLTEAAERGTGERRSMEEYLERARQMADRSEYREAVAYLLLAAIADITARGFVTHRVGLTHRDYYRAIRRDPEQSREYLKILKIYEPLAFGRRVAELSHYQVALQSLEAGFRDTPTIS